MSQPPYGAPQGQPGQPPPPAYLGGGAPGGAPFQGAPPPAYGGPPPAYGGPGGQFGGPGLSGLTPASKPRSTGLVIGLITAFAMIGFVVLVALITLNN